MMSGRSVRRSRRSIHEVVQLRVQCPLEGRSLGATLQIGTKTRFRGYEIRVSWNAQYGRHHKVADREAVTVKIGFVTECV